MAIDYKSPIAVACITVITVEVVIGIFIHLFIVFVVLKNAHRIKTVHSGDSIRAAMARSSIILTSVLFAFFLCYIFLSKMSYTLKVVFDFFIIYGISSTLYATAIFCFFLFIKIVQIKSGVLAWAKRKVTALIPRLLVAVQVFSLCCSCLSFVFFSVNGEVYTNGSAVPTTNVNEGEIWGRKMSFLILAVFLGPYFLMAMPTILAVGSLILHSQKMKVMKITGAVNNEAYKSTVRKMMGLLIIHTLYCCILIITYFVGLSDLVFGFWAVSIIMFLLSPAKSIILIYSNTKLRNEWKMMMGRIFCCKSFVQAENT